MTLLIFTCCSALVIYHHVVYPFILRILGNYLNRMKPSEVVYASLPMNMMPSVGLLIPAHNEERVISQKIVNCSEIDYSSGRIVTVVALDGCGDNTEDVLKTSISSLPEFRVKIEKIVDNIGKVAVLNRLIPEMEVDIIALSDASALLNADAIKRAVAHFADPRVGVVCGTYVMPDNAGSGERSYWRYQVQIKTLEAQLAAPMGAHGAFYAFRRALWRPLEADTINDDFVLPMRIVADGWRAVYDPRIVARELDPTSPRQDFRRRVRIGAGNLQQSIRLWRLANPKRFGLAFVFLSGKGLRSVMPLVLLAIFAATVSLALSEGGIVWHAMLGAQMAIAALSAAGTMMPQSLPRLFHPISYFIQGYVASGLGALLLLSGYGGAAWKVSNLRRDSGAVRSMR